MNKLKVYLSGAVKLAEEEFQGWRNKCLGFTESGYYPNLRFIDPNSYFNYTDKLPQTDKQCIDLFMWQIEQCDVLLLNLDSTDISVGAGMEVEHAYCHGVPIVGFGEKTGTWYKWAETRAAVVFKTLEDALDYITKSYARI